MATVQGIVRTRRTLHITRGTGSDAAEAPFDLFRAGFGIGEKVNVVLDGGKIKDVKKLK